LLAEEALEATPGEASVEVAKGETGQKGYEEPGELDGGGFGQGLDEVIEGVVEEKEGSATVEDAIAPDNTVAPGLVEADGGEESALAEMEQAHGFSRCRRSG
jgi:hypothetical protein